MKAGKSNDNVGERVKITGLTEEDEFLNGREGTLTHPFGCFPIGDVGVYLDHKADMNGICNLLVGEYKIITEETLCQN